MTASFRQFFEDVWGYGPFPWQERLAARVQASGWPDVLDLPTGSGKTAALDIALYHFAMDGGVTAPRRIILVVDRRVIVDQVGRRAKRLRSALLARKTSAVAEVADRLRDIVGDDAPSLLETAVLRGAALRDDAWARHPHVPVLAASTVDQVGSRLLFRGYGVSDSMKPVHAGLVGCDTLLLLDEVHLSRPFADVLRQLDRLRGAVGTVPRRFQVVQLSATPSVYGEDVFRLDREVDAKHDVLRKRLQARKPVTLELVKVKARADDSVKRQAVADRAASVARELVAEGRRAVALVVNRVDTARRAWRALESPDFDRVLVTGRMRPLDQHAQLERIGHRVLADRKDRPEEKPLVLVATQCIEAGADFDFDGLVTECASLDALRQRFGRLDRRGERPSRGVVLCRSDQEKSSDDDPVYGDSLARTWAWLNELSRVGELDFGIDGLQPHLDALGVGVDALRAPVREAPVVLPTYLDQWVQTNPAPHADPDVALFLHGIPADKRSVVPDVQVVWRSDIAPEALEVAAGDPGKASGVRRSEIVECLTDLLSATPPGALEALSLPVWALRRWLAPPADLEVSRAADDIADVDGQPAMDTDVSRARGGKPVLVWNGRQGIDVVSVAAVRPGQLVILPSAYGGLGRHGTFEPEPTDAEKEPVADLGDAVQLLQRGRPSLRLTPGHLGYWLGDAFVPGLEIKAEGDHWVLDEEDDHRACLREIVHAARQQDVDGKPAWLRATLRGLGSRPRLLPVRRMDGHVQWQALGRPMRAGRLRKLLGDSARAAGHEAPSDVTTDGNDGAFTGASAELTTHLVGVAGKASAFAKAARLPDSIVAALSWAGRIHDVGKVDSRFQLWLYNGDEVASAVANLVLAKSTTPSQDRVMRRLARERSGYPRGQRHELVSLDMAERSEELRQRVEASGADWDLVLHLVASHHGWCRPAAPPAWVPDEDAEDVAWDVDGVTLSGTTAHGRARIASGVVDRFWRMVRRYGWHELAYLEAVLRLADHRRSAEEQGGA